MGFPDEDCGAHYLDSRAWEVDREMRLLPDEIMYIVCKVTYRQA